ncbi:MAG: hypothetical protein HY690_19570, partial [Chloroflexi bacterium]|nr:hypothetical protein [Chloroflexota bacterium]
MLWAPPFPRWLDRPGFWDRAHVYRYPIEPVYAVAVLDERGRELPLELAGRRWQPGELGQTYRGPGGLEVAETRVATPDDCLVSLLRLHNGPDQARRLGLVVWTCQPGEGLEAAGAERERASFRRRLTLASLPPLSVSAALGVSLPARAGLALAEHGAPTPTWAFSPLSERLDEGSLGGSAPFAHLGVVGQVELAAGQSQSVVCAAALALDPAAAAGALERCLAAPAPLDTTRRSWEQFFASAPSFTCSDPYLEQAYWYRWYGLRLLTIDRPALNYRHSVVCEGIDYFRAPISYSAQCHLREVRWLDSPRLGQGLLRTFTQHQRPDGSLPGLVPPQGEYPEVFYHADWGGAALALHQVHPDPAFLAEIYPALAGYAAYLEQVRDPDGSGLCEVWNHYETGQEYMSRYLFADPQADREHWGNVFRLKGVDASVYAYQTYRALAALAAELGRPEAAERWQRAAQKAGQAIRAALWDPAQEFFVDALPGSLARSPAKAAVGFYPFMADLAGPEHLGALRRHLLDPGAFWTPFPVPSTSADDPLFSAEGLWRDVRRNCPWNGRVWPMANSHVAEALVRAAEHLDEALLPAAAEFLHRFVRLLFFDQDPARPNCFEHYHPFT